MGDEFEPRPSSRPAPIMTPKERGQIIRRRMKESQGAVWTVAEWMSARGHIVEIHPPRYTKKANEWEKFVDGGDLFTLGKTGENPDARQRRRIEVKQLTVDFTSADDWPFRGKFIVNDKLVHDRTAPPPAMYVVVNRAATHAACVFAASRQYWTVEPRDDDVLKRTRDFYFCPMVHITFYDMREAEQ